MVFLPPTFLRILVVAYAAAEDATAVPTAGAAALTAAAMALPIAASENINPPLCLLFFAHFVNFLLRVCVVRLTRGIVDCVFCILLVRNFLLSLLYYIF
jgi:hypothetical protein